MTERPTDADSPFVFLVGGNGCRRLEPLSYPALAKLFARACERASLREPWITLHALRHTHATRMWEGGMRELTLKSGSVMPRPESTRIYTRGSPIPQWWPSIVTPWAAMRRRTPNPMHRLENHHESRGSVSRRITCASARSCHNRSRPHCERGATYADFVDTTGNLDPIYRYQENSIGAADSSSAGQI